MNTVKQIKKFMEPKSVAIFGVSSKTTGKGSLNILQHLVGYGYHGKLYPINPNASKIMGIKCYSTIKEVPEKCDLAIINLPRQVIPGIVEECAESGVDSVVIATQGFADAGDEEGKKLQHHLDEIIERTGIRIMGPNSLGTANAFSNFSSSFVRLSMERNPIGVICQTGFFVVGYPSLKSAGKVIDLGNGCDIDFSEAIHYFEEDKDIRVIALHIEGTNAGQKLLEAATATSRKKPVVALKTGRSKEAARSVQSHSGALAGSDEIWDAGLRQSGIIRVEDVEDLAETVKSFASLPPMRGKGLGIVTYSGAAGIMCVDACQRYGLEVPELSQSTVDQLAPLCPAWQELANPVDIWPAIMVERKASMPEVEETMTDVLLNDPRIDAVLCVISELFTPGEVRSLKPMVKRLARSHPDKPLVFHLYGPFAAESKSELEGTGKTR
ncbi:MAG: acetate--CoA ligase family protein, partial [Dehalococcoidia bacterium]